MHSFKDAKGRGWTIDVNVQTIMEVRAKTEEKTDLLTIADGDLLQKLSTDPMAMAGVLWVLCEKQAGAQNVTAEEFGGGLRGDAIEDATNALLEDLADFFPKGRRSLLTKAMSKAKQLEETATAEAIRRMDSGEPEKRLRQAMQAMPSATTSGDSPASLGLIPVPSPSASLP